MEKDATKKLIVKVGIEAENWEVAIKKAGGLLLEIGAIKPIYIDKMIAIVKEFGSYIVIAPGVAIAHARPEDGVNFTCYSLVTLKKPVYFGNIENDPVKLLIIVAASDNNDHLDLLKKIAEIISNKEKYNAIIHSKEESEIFKILD